MKAWREERKGHVAQSRAETRGRIAPVQWLAWSWSVMWRAGRWSCFGRYVGPDQEWWLYSVNSGETSIDFTWEWYHQLCITFTFQSPESSVWWCRLTAVHPKGCHFYEWCCLAAQLPTASTVRHRSLWCKDTYKELYISACMYICVCL